jgi:hypothetical protein
LRRAFRDYSMSLKIKQIIPTNNLWLFYAQPWVEDPDSLEFLEVKDLSVKKLMQRAPTDYCKACQSPGLVLIEKGEQQSIVPLFYSDEDGEYIPLFEDTDPLYLGSTTASFPDGVSREFMLKVINKVKGIE